MMPKFGRHAIILPSDAAVTVAFVKTCTHLPVFETAERNRTLNAEIWRADQIGHLGASLC